MSLAEARFNTQGHAHRTTQHDDMQKAKTEYGGHLNFSAYRPRSHFGSSRRAGARPLRAAGAVRVPCTPRRRKATSLGVARALSDAFAGGTGEDSSWSKRGRGPTLRQFFEAYGNPDIWSVYRKARQVNSSGSGYISYEELHEIIALADFSLLFLWDIFAQQNELLSVREFLTAVCVLSSAALKEKARFLMSVFDASQTGTCTGAEVGQMCVMVVGIVAHCTGIPVKAKEIIAGLRGELPGLLPQYMEAAKRVGGTNAFQELRIIGTGELEKLLSTIQDTYQELPFAGPPSSAGARKPPPPEWGNHTPDDDLVDTLVPPAAGGGPAAVRALISRQNSKATLSRQGSNAALGASQLPDGRQPQPLQSPAARASLEKAHRWLVIHGGDFDEVAKDLPSFRYLFIKSVSSALGVPSGCIQVASVSEGSIIVDFTIQPCGRGGDTRDAKTLAAQLEEQFGSPRSALRMGHFREYAATAELLTHEMMSARESAAALPAAARADAGSGACRRVQCDRGMQASDLEVQLGDVLGRLEAARQHTRGVEAALGDALEELRQKDLIIADLRQMRKKPLEEERQQRPLGAGAGAAAASQEERPQFGAAAQPQGCGRGAAVGAEGAPGRTGGVDPPPSHFAFHQDPLWFVHSDPLLIDRLGLTDPLPPSSLVPAGRALP
eukprot:CAMPEP_0179330190 /NCGR_PEP_ID=MMETSP0797-20121207/63533_1 /TAXON_ID=47934 /ORGANISM="Dinophysis acuminata, Strain DAEP01" /LENGTH=666 /DNA_ID=CAMNT_0021042905 /DNA_START=66 /DNA_END=2064 /DNA_ORIENTATION=-